MAITGQKGITLVHNKKKRDGSKINFWNLFEDHPDFDLADRAMTNGWEYAKTFATPQDAWGFMHGVMERFLDAGAGDTEPREILRQEITHFYGYFEEI